MNTFRPFHFHSSAAAACNSWAVRLARVRRTPVTRRPAGVAVAGRVGRAGSQAAGRPVGDDARHGVAATVVVAEHLGEEAPDGGDRVEHPVAILDAVFVEDVQDAGFGQDVGEGKPLVAREAGRAVVPNSSCERLCRLGENGEEMSLVPASETYSILRRLLD